MRAASRLTSSRTPFPETGYSLTSETMQYEIDRDSSILEQIMPDSEEKLELVDGIPKMDDEK